MDAQHLARSIEDSVKDATREVRNARGQARELLGLSEIVASLVGKLFGAHICHRP